MLSNPPPLCSPAGPPQLVLGPRKGGLGIHDAADMTGRSAAPLGRRPAPFLVAIRNLFVEAPPVHVRGQDSY